jgi:predicted transcriptional regulator
MTKVTLTVELPDDLAERLNALPDEERSRRTAAALRAMDAREQAVTRRGRKRHTAPVPAGDLSAEDVAAVRQGLAELEAGQEVASDAVFASLFRRVGLAPDETNPAARHHVRAVRAAIHRRRRGLVEDGLRGSGPAVRRTAQGGIGPAGPGNGPVVCGR